SSRVDFDQKLERYARVDRQGNISVRRVADDAEICRLQSGIGSWWPYLSPDGRFLALAVTPRCKLWKLDGRGAAELPVDQSADSCASSPDSRQFALGHADGSLSLYELPSGRRLRRLVAGPVAQFLAFDPQGRRLALGCRALAQIRDLATGEVCATFP